MGWTKFFGDGQQIHEPESWSRTRLDNMTKVRLVHGDAVLELIGPYEYWQSDSYEVTMVQDGNPQPTLTHRRIEQFYPVDGNWYILELDVRNNQITDYTSKERI